VNLIQYKEKLQQSQGKRQHIRSKLRETEGDIASQEKRLHGLEEAQIFLQKVAQDTQGQLRFHIRDIVQTCFEALWPGEVSFDIVFEISRGKTEAKLVFTIDGEEVDIMDSDGGGAVDIAAFALRIAAWSLGKTRNTIILDEAFKHLSDDLQPLAAEVLKELSEKLNLQIIQVTHRKEMIGVADRVFEVSRKRVGEFWQSEVKTI